MATATKTWAFASGAEGFTDAGISNITPTYASGDGSPSNGSMYFSVPSTSGYKDEKSRSAAGESWETWGIPAGAVITNLDVSFYRKVNNQNFVRTDTYYRLSVVDASNAPVHASELLLVTGIPPTSWTSASNSGVAVSAAYQASSTNVKMEVEIHVSHSASAARSYYFDTIALVITYTEGGGGVPKHSNYYMSIRQGR